MRIASAAFSRFGTSSLSRPVFLFSLLCLTLSLIFNSLILAGSTSPSATLRNWYLVSFKYNTNSEFYKTLESIYSAKDKITDTKDKVHDTIDKLNPFSKRDSEQPTFSEIRVGYRGLCVDTSHGWECAYNAAKLSTQDIGKDPLQLVEIADMYKDKIVWSLPFWLCVSSTAVAWIMVIVNAVPIPITMPAWTKKVAAGCLAIAAVSSLGAMVLAGVISSSVSTIIDKVTVDAIQVHIGRTDLCFGWTVFALVTVSMLGVCAIVTAEWGVNKVTAAVEAQAEKGVNAATGGRFGMSEVQNASAKLDALKKGKGLPEGYSFVKSLRK
ncbi:Ca2+ regulator and membrane fusion protein Fig1-domain-containing protein [Terfezia claveryi]|nr:Ca2+ regulator and membrane fusion protein Fig1-domain-containing protein [Terfezia claveryi]KAF8453375.1 Ca2+ regulator and membrane fusion protein Fig1-domain-containing protein [Terfezia claveryi]